MSVDFMGMLLGRHDLTADQAGMLLRHLADADQPMAQRVALLTALTAKGHTSEELRGMAVVLREEATRVSIAHMPGPVADTCGTGGDGSHSFNISTASSLLAAACGLKMAKHGNRGISSRSGSTDVLNALGVPLADGPEMAVQQLDELGFTYLNAPTFHPMVAGVMPVRQALGVRTIFNELGPLINPSQPSHQLLGAFSPEAARRMAHALAAMDIERAFVVHGTPGWDEATPCGPFLLCDVQDGRVVEEMLDPVDIAGLPRCEPGELAGDTPQKNARQLSAIFNGARGAVRDAVLLNAALVLHVAGLVPTVRDGVARGSAAIDDGGAMWFLERAQNWQAG